MVRLPQIRQGAIFGEEIPEQMYAEVDTTLEALGTQALASSFYIPGWIRQAFSSVAVVTYNVVSPPQYHSAWALTTQLLRRNTFLSVVQGGDGKLHLHAPMEARTLTFKTRARFQDCSANRTIYGYTYDWGSVCYGATCTREYADEHAHARLKCIWA